MKELRTPVLVVGAGPAGLSVTALLAKYGIETLTVTRYPGTANSPRAHITNQRHLEQQLVSILGKATDVDSTLKVHHELTTVRTEIDRLEGRKRFLDTETALAKISLSLSPLRPVVAATPNEFGVSLRHAAADSVTIAAAVVTFTIRAVGVLLPVSLMFGVPALGVVLLLRRRQRKLAAALAG